MSGLDDFLVYTNTIIPHVYIGLGAIMVAVVALFFIPAKYHSVVYFIIFLITACVGTDLAAHGYSH
jgi:uncharacterized membrane protein YccC